VGAAWGGVRLWGCFAFFDLFAFLDPATPMCLHSTAYEQHKSLTSPPHPTIHPQVRVRTTEGGYALSHVDAVVDDMLRKEYLFDIALPHIPNRWVVLGVGCRLWKYRVLGLLGAWGGGWGMAYSALLRVVVGVGNESTAGWYLLPVCRQCPKTHEMRPQCTQADHGQHWSTGAARERDGRGVQRGCYAGGEGRGSL